MLTYRLLEETTEYTKYEYLPEKSNSPGIVLLFNEGGFEVIRPSSDDEHGIYAKHAIFDIPKHDKEKGTIAWY